MACHGTITAPATLQTTAQASPGTDLTALSTPFGQPRFQSRRGKITQRSMVTDGVEWEIKQVLDSVTPGNPNYSEKSRLAKTMQRDGKSWGDATVDPKALAHANSSMTCYACHSAWTTSCFGCHLSQKANEKKPMLHNEGGESRNAISYNFQTLRDDIYFLAKDGTVTRNRTAPARSAYAAEYKAHKARGEKLKEAYHHGGDVVSLQLRGEYIFAAQGKDGLRVYDVAQVDHKGFSERMVSAPVSPLGQKLYVDTKDATSVALLSTMTIDPARSVQPANQEQKVHPLYDYAYVTDREEGLVIVGPLHTLLDGDPRNNFAKRAGSFNQGGALAGATSMTIAGTVGYVTTPRGIVVLGLDDPVKPRIIAQVGAPLRSPRAAAIQFRYAFVLDADRLKVLDLTFPASPRAVESATVPLNDARSIYLA